MLARPDRRLAHDLRDVFGWSLPFAPDLLPVDLRRIVEDGDLAEPAGDGALRAKARVSSLDETLFAHSPYPTVQEDAVFFGPDSYRFANLIAAELERTPDRQIYTALDIGTGAGVGAIVIKQRSPHARVLATDVNPAAVRFAAVNAAAAGVAIESIESAAIPLPGMPIDLVVANPPYIIDPDSRAYRDGGDLHGAQVSVDMVDSALPRLAEHGTLILYTGSAIVRGEDALQSRLQAMAGHYRRNLRYVTLDPDVFGEELEKPLYRDVERIALVAAILN